MAVSPQPFLHHIIISGRGRPGQRSETLLLWHHRPGRRRTRISMCGTEKLRQGAKGFDVKGFEDVEGVVRVPAFLSLSEILISPILARPVRSRLSHRGGQGRRREIRSTLWAGPVLQAVPPRRVGASCSATHVRETAVRARAAMRAHSLRIQP